MTAGIILIVVGVMVLFATIFVAFQIVPKLGARFGSSGIDVGGTTGPVPPTPSWLRNSTLAFGLLTTAALIVIGLFLVITAEDEDNGSIDGVHTPTATDAQAATPRAGPSTEAPSAPATVTAPPPSEICATTWEVTSGGGTFEFESAETRNGDAVCRYTEFNNIGGFFGEGTATVKTNEVHLAGFDSFLGDYETDLEIRDDSMVGDKAYEQGGRFPLTLHRQ